MPIGNLSLHISSRLIRSNSAVCTSALRFTAVYKAKFRSKVFSSSCSAVQKKNVWSTTALLQTFDFQRTLSSLSTRSGATLNKQDSNNSKNKKKAEIRMEPLFVQKIVRIICPH